MPGMRNKHVPPVWAVDINGWTAALRAAGRSPETIRTRTDHLRRASRALGGEPMKVTPVQLLTWVGGQDWSRETRRSVYASLRSFWQWAAGVGLIETSPADVLPSVSPGQPRARPTPERVYKSALGAADEREKLILRLGAECGMRRAEIAQVHVRDLVEDLDGWSLIAHGKGGKDRLVPMDEGLATAVRARLLATGGWLLPGNDNGHLSARYVGILASRLLPEGWTLHTLRHRCATVARAKGSDIQDIQELLGHASVATTQRYVRVPGDAVRRAVRHAAAA